jgi:hypothetical protein
MNVRCVKFHCAQRYDTMRMLYEALWHCLLCACFGIFYFIKKSRNVVVDIDSRPQGGWLAVRTPVGARYSFILQNVQTSSEVQPAS